MTKPTLMRKTTLVSIVFVTSASIVSGTDSTQTVPPSQWSAALRKYVSSSQPSADHVRALGAADEVGLLQIWQSEKALSGKQRLIWGLASVCGKNGVKGFQECLWADYGPEPLSLNDEAVLFQCVLGLGFAASRNDDAFMFLVRGVDPEFWEKRRWQSRLGSHSCDILVGYSIQALGISGRQSAWEVLRNLRGRDLLYQYRFAGSIVQGIMYLDLRREHGAARIEEYIYGDKSSEEFEEWTATPIGREWKEWGDRRTRGPRPAAATNKAPARGGARQPIKTGEHQ